MGWYPGLAAVAVSQPRAVAAGAAAPSDGNTREAIRRMAAEVRGQRESALRAQGLLARHGQIAKLLIESVREPGGT